MVSLPGAHFHQPAADSGSHSNPAAAISTPSASGTPSHPQRAQIRRLGTKGQKIQLYTIINQMPPHRVYIEPFGGWFAVMKAKLPADRNIGLDLNPDRIAEAKRELPSSAELACMDAIRYLKNFKWQGGELVYADPPYLFDTRTHVGSRYEFELSDHRRLLDVLSSLPCYVMLSGYWSSLYAESLRTWRTLQYKAPTRGGPRDEYLWCNFPEPLELHDYRFLGATWRDRQNIRRRIKRWSTKLSNMPRLEQQAMLAAIQSFHLEQSQSPRSSVHTSGVDG